jgi:hypothetical protein
VKLEVAAATRYVAPRMPRLSRKLRRFCAALLVAVVAFCPLATACLAHSLVHAGAAATSAAAGHDHSHHADPSAPAKAGVPDGCNAIQHCAPFAWSGDAPSTATVLDFAAVRFPPPGATTATGIVTDPDVPPPRSPS